MSHQVYEYAVVGVYFIFVLLIGFTFRRFSHNVSDYFRSGARAKWWLVGFSAFISGISAYTFTGAAGVVFEAGWSAVYIYIGNALAFLLAFLFAAAWFRRLRAITLPEVIRIRFGGLTQQIYAWFGVALFVLVGGGLGLYALAIFTASVFGLNVYFVILVMGVIVLAYVTAGGSWGVMATDFLQGVIVMAATITLTIFALSHVGGFSGLNNLLQQQNATADMAWIKEAGQFSANRYTLAWAIAMMVKQGITGVSLLSAPRYLAAKTDTEARWGALLAFGLMLLGSSFWFIPPLAARALYPELVEAMPLSKPGESAYAIISLKLLPTGMVGLMVACMFAATMSTLDTALNRNAAIIVCDIIPSVQKRLKRSAFSESQQLRLSQWITLFLGVVSIVSAITFASIDGLGMFELIIMIGTLLGLPMLVPMVLGLFIARVPWWSALVAIGTGLVGSTLGYTLGWNFQTQVFVNLTCGAIGFLGTMPFYRATDEHSTSLARETFRLIRTPIDFEKEIGQANDAQQYQVVGQFVLAAGLLIMLMLLLPNGWSGRVSIVAMGAAVSLTGLLMLWRGRCIRAATSPTPDTSEELANLQEQPAVEPVPSDN